MADEKEKEVTIEEEAGLPANWHPVPTSPMIPGRSLGGPVGAPPPVSTIDNFQSGQLPPFLGLAPDLVASGTPGPGVPATRLMPIMPSGVSQQVAGVQSTATTIVKNAILAIPVSPVAPPATEVTDGLIHGETPWESDPAFVDLRDDFYQGDTGTAHYGALTWQIVNGANNALWSGYMGTGHAGAISWDNNTVAGQAGQMVPGFVNASNQFSGAWSGLFDVPAWKMIYVFKFLRAPTLSSSSTFSMAHKSVYIGMGFDANVTAHRQSVFIGLRYDTDTTAPSINDTTFHFEAVANPISASRNNTQGNVTDTLIVPTENVWYRLEITSKVAGQVNMSLSNGTSTFTQTAIVVPTSTSTLTTVQGQTGQLLFGTGGVPFPVCPGSLMTVSAVPAPNAGFNGTWEVTDASTSSITAIGNVTLGNTGTSGNLSAKPCVWPTVIFGNDTAASPSTSAKIIVDYFAFIWNPGVNGGTGTPSGILSRYW